MVMLLRGIECERGKGRIVQGWDGATKTNQIENWCPYENLPKSHLIDRKIYTPLFKLVDLQPWLVISWLVIVQERGEQKSGVGGRYGRWGKGVEKEAEYVNFVCG
jgi:hypothetical protein